LKDTISFLRREYLPFFPRKYVLTPFCTTLTFRLLVQRILDKDFSLEELAKQFNLNPVYLSNLFAKEMGVSLIKYCNNRRINRAIVLLSNTNYTISEIAYQLGAGNAASFSRLFKRHHGITPVEFRRTLHIHIASQEPIRNPH